MDGSYHAHKKPAKAETAAESAQGAAGFLRQLDGLVTIAALKPDGKPVCATVRMPEAEKRVAEDIAKLVVARQSNLYFVLNEPGEGLLGSKSKPCEADISRLRGVAIDIDPDATVEATPGGFEQERERLLDFAEQLRADPQLAPTFCVDTGNGIQAFWLFPEPIENSPENRAAVKAQAKGLALRFGGDKVQSVEHLFRVPFTTNYPNAKKIAKGRTVSQSRLLYVNASQRLGLAELAKLAQPVFAAEAPAIDLSGLDYSAIVDAAENGPDSLPDRLRSAANSLLSSPAVERALKKADRSERDWAVAAMCIDAGLSDPTDLGTVLFSLCPEKLLEKEEAGSGESYAAGTIGKALSKIAPINFAEFFHPIEQGNDARQARQRAVRGFHLVSLDDIQDPDPEFLVDGLIETDSLTQVFGDPGAGKSFLAIDLAASVASGRAFHGRKVRQGPVVYVAGEGRNGLKRRFRAWSLEHGESLDGIPLALSTSSADLSDPNSVGAVAASLDAFASKHGPIAMIVIDTLARNFGGGDENDTRDMNRFVVALDRLKDQFPGCTVLVVHHTGHGDKSRARGAKALQGALDTEYRVDKTGETMVVTNTKMKEGQQPAPLHFNMKPVTIGQSQAGKPIESVALEEVTAPHKVSVERFTAGMQLGLSTFAAAQAIGAAGEPVHLEAWRKAFFAAHIGDSADAKRKAFQRARKELVDRGYLSVKDDLYTEGASAWPMQ